MSSIMDGRLSGALGIPFSFPLVPSIKVLFTTAEQGNFSLDVKDQALLGPAKSLRHALRVALGLSSWTELRQVHGGKLLAEPEASDHLAPGSLEADGAATKKPGHALLVKTADCQPVMLAHKSGKYVAALHVGWRGNALEFPTSGVRDFCRIYGIKPDDVLAVRGPSLGPGRAEFVNFKSEWPQGFHHLVQPDNTMDLWALTRDQLESAGLLPENIFGLDLCTASLPGYFYSYRNKDQARQVSLVWIEEPQELF